MLLHVDPYVHVGVDVGEGAAARSSAVTSTQGGWQAVEFTVAAASVALVEITPAKAMA